jgi:hypothetical protein
MNALRALLPLLSISLNEDAGGAPPPAGGGGEVPDGDGSSGEGSGANSSGQPDKDAAGAGGSGSDDAAKKAAADALAALTKSYDTWKPTLPKDMPFDEKGFGDFRKLFIEAGVKPEVAQKFVDAFAGAELGRLRQVAAGLKAEEAEWVKAIESDKELAGEGTPEQRRAFIEGTTMANAAKAMQKLATPGFRELLKKSRLERHPEMIRTMARIGAGMAEDTTAGSKTAGKGPDATPEQRLKSRYPNSKEMFTKP